MFRLLCARACVSAQEADRVLPRTADSVCAAAASAFAASSGSLYGAELKSKDERDTLDDARGGRIEGGTWEHRARAREMAATAQKAAMVTEHAIGGGNAGRRAHHMGHFLPKDKLEAFLAKCRAVVESEGESTTQGAAAAQALNDYADNTLDANNIGFQMLKGLGWTEGSGLGAKSSGITAPVRATHLCRPQCVWHCTVRRPCKTLNHHFRCVDRLESAMHKATWALAWPIRAR
jgi:hypothetical protein